MDLDLNKFRTLLPISALYEDNLLFLAEFSRRIKFPHGEVIIERPEDHPESIYLMSGEIKLNGDDDDEPEVLVAGTDRSLYPINNPEAALFQCQVCSDSATFIRVDNHLLNKLLAWGELSTEQSVSEEVEFTLGPSAAKSEWMMAMLRTAIFTRLPSANIQALFERMEEIKVDENEVIVRQGEPGDYFYVIQEGRCKVTLTSESSDTILAELGPCSSFGEEALISDAPRNASVTMLTRGVLMRLSKKDFSELMEAPVMQWVDRAGVQTQVNYGAELIDVRFRKEFEKDALPFAINIPVNKLRAGIPGMDKSKTYVVYCDTGQRSSVAAFLLMQRGFDVHILKNGLRGA